MKHLLTFFLMLISNVLFSQTMKAPMNVIVTDKAGYAIPNDKITFVATKSKREITGITNERGQFKVYLPAGDEYSIKVEVIGEQLNYAKFDVPTPPPGAIFNTRTLEIRYEIPASVVLEDLHFASGNFIINEDSYAVLDQLANYLIRKKTTKIRIEGHTDSDGSEASNQRLSENRAQAVKKYLESKGVPSKLIEATGLGEDQPRADNSTPEGKAANRRTEIHIVD